MKTWQKYRNLAIRAKSIDLYEQMKIFLIRWSKLIRFLIIVTLSTIKGREGAVTLTLVRGEQRGDSGDTCWYPPPLIYVSSGDIVSDVSPLPQFLDNRVVLLPIWKLPCRCRVRNSRQVLLFMGSGEGQGWLSLSVKQNVSCLRPWTKYEKTLFPFPTLLTALDTSIKRIFFYFFCLHSMICFYEIRLAWVDFNVFIIVSVGHSDNSGTPSLSE